MVVFPWNNYAQNPSNWINHIYHELEMAVPKKTDTQKPKASLDNTL